MPIKTIFELISALFGFIASIFFIFGVLKLNAKEITKQAATKYGGNPNISNAMSLQKADYTIGALYLLISFLLLILKTLIPQEWTILQSQSIVCLYLSILVLVSLTLVPALALRHFVFSITKTKSDIELKSKGKNQK